MRATRKSTIARWRKRSRATCPSSAARVLDYGSGEALHANLVAAVAGQVLLCEGAPKVCASVASRFAHIPNIRALAPEEVERLQPHSLDLIVLHPVTQYLTPDETQALFALFHRLLERNGMLKARVATRNRSCRPNAPFAELVRLSRTSIADEMREGGRRRVF
jgi:hypothetical protein